MKTISVEKEGTNYETYRAQRVKSLFNAEYGHKFSISVDTDIDEFDWKIGVVVGASGTGKTSIGKTFFDGQIYDLKNGWADDLPIIDAIAPDGDFNSVTSALSAVGLGSVPSWLRPFSVLSNGEQFRAGLARLLLSDEKAVVLDEFTSVIDRQVARIASGAFQKAWRRKEGRQAVILTPHYDILPWLEPDWIIDTNAKNYKRGCLQRSVLVKKEWTYKDLWREALFPLGVQMILETLKMIEDGKYSATPQDESLATWEPPVDQNTRLFRPELMMLP